MIIVYWFWFLLWLTNLSSPRVSSLGFRLPSFPATSSAEFTIGRVLNRVSWSSGRWHSDSRCLLAHQPTHTPPGDRQKQTTIGFLRRAWVLCSGLLSVSAGRHPLLPEWAQQATVCVHGDAEQCVGADKANIVLLYTLASFSHPLKLGFGFGGFAEPGVGIRARNCSCCISELSKESTNEPWLLC